MDEEEYLRTLERLNSCDECQWKVIEEKATANRRQAKLAGGHEGVGTSTQDKEEWRESIIWSSNTEQQRAFIANLVPAMKMGFGSGVETMQKVSLQFVVVVRNSSDDVVGDVRAWAKKCFDYEGMTADVKDNVTEFLVVIVTQIR